jgi:hypothetical protein
MLFGHFFMAAAESTQAFTERQMDIQTDAFNLVGFIK